MRTRLVLFAPILLACSSPVGESLATPEPEASAGSVPGCYSLALDGTPAEFVLPATIELSTEPAPGSLDPLRFAVRELGGGEPRAPISSWALDLEGTLELVLGGGFTGYTFSLRPAGDGGWEGIGEYCSDMGVLPEPERLPLRLVRRSCS